MTIHYDMPRDEYDALEAWNWSLIKQLELGSPKHLQHIKQNGSQDTASRVLLRAIHTLAFEPHLFDAEYSVYEGRRAGAKYTEHCANNPGTHVLNPKEYSQAALTAESARTALEELGAIDGHGEVTLTWTDEETGLPCKARVDWLTDSAMYDLKTIGTTHDRQVAGIVARNLYHGQLAHYTAGLRANGIDAPAYIIAAEGKGAHDVAVFELDEGIPDGALHVGMELRYRLMQKLEECVKTNHWPGRYEGVQTLMLPSYALIRAEEMITFGEGL